MSINWIAFLAWLGFAATADYAFASRGFSFFTVNQS